MRKFQALRISLLLVALISIFMFPACKSKSPFTVIFAGVEPLKLSRLSLVNIWDSVVESAGFQETEAQFVSFSMTADKDGDISIFDFNFDVTEPDGYQAYYVSANGSGTIRYYSSKGHGNINNPNPREIFTEIDSVGLYSLTPGDGGISMRIDFIGGGDGGYSNDYIDIYKITSGQLIPLKDIKFGNNKQWCEIIFSNISVSENITHINGTTITMGTIQRSGTSGRNPVEAVAPGGNPFQELNTQIWFLSEDVDRAETVEYLK